MAQFLISTTGVVTLTDLGNRILPSGLNSVDIGTEFRIEELRYSADLASAIEAGTLEVIDDGRGRGLAGPVSNAVATAFVEDIYHFDDSDVTNVIGTSTLDALSGVTLTSPIVNGEALVYNGGTGEWENQAVAGGVTSVNTQTGVVVLDTDDLLEGTNKFYATSLFDTDFGTKSTTDLLEGTNLYYTDVRARAAISIAAGSASYLGYNSGTGEISVTALAITTVDVFGGYTDTGAFIAAEYSVGNEFQEGDAVVLTAITAGVETYIHNGGVAGTIADFTLIQQPNLDQATVRGYISGTLPINYNNTTGVISLDLKANGGLVIESNTLALDLGASAITGILAEGDGGTGTGTYATGDILYASAANTLSKLAAGSLGQHLEMAGGVPTWATPAAGAGKKTWSWGATSSSSNTTDRYLDRHDGAATNQSPYVAFFACKLRSISASTVVAESWTAEVYVNGASVSTIVISAADTGTSTGLDISVAAGDKVSFYCNGTGIDMPSIDALFEEV